MSEPTRHPDLAQQEDTIPTWGVLGVLAATIAIFAILVAWAWYTTKLEVAVVRPSGQFPEKRLGPRHDVDEVEQRLFEEQGAGQALKIKQREALDRFGWVDRDHGIVSIPIDDAMDIAVEGGQK